MPLPNTLIGSTDIDEKHIVINQEFVAGKLHDVVQNVDLSHYIL